MSSSEIPDAILNDVRISAAELGVLIYLMTRAAAAKTTLEELRARFNCGRERLQSSLRALERLGYLRVERPRDPASRFLGVFYAVVDPSRERRSPGKAESPNAFGAAP